VKNAPDKAEVENFWREIYEGWRGLVQVEAAYKAEITSIAEYLKAN
jgi:hypothetical protein